MSPQLPALALTREMPQTLAALSSGQVSEWRATLVVKETALLPVAQGVACYAALARAADTARAAGDGEAPRGRGQLMADTLVQRLTGQATATGTSVEVGLVMTDQALLAGSPDPSELVGHGPIPAETARGLVRSADRAWVRRLYTHSDSGALVAMDSRRRLFAGQLRHLLVLHSQTCASPYCDAPVRHADYARPVRAGGTTSVDNGAALCEACNYTKDLPGWDATVHTVPTAPASWTSAPRRDTGTANARRTRPAPPIPGRGCSGRSSPEALGSTAPDVRTTPGSVRVCRAPASVTSSAASWRRCGTPTTAG